MLGYACLKSASAACNPLIAASQPQIVSLADISGCGVIGTLVAAAPPVVPIVAVTSDVVVVSVAAATGAVSVAAAGAVVSVAAAVGTVAVAAAGGAAVSVPQPASIVASSTKIAVNRNT